MLAWLSRSLDYQLDFGAASFFFFFQYFGDVIQLSSVGFLDVCSALWNLSIFSQLPGVSPACVQLRVWLRIQDSLLVSGSPSLYSCLLPSAWLKHVNCLVVWESQFLSYLLSDFISVCHLYRRPHGENQGERAGYIICLPFLKNLIPAAFNAE